MNVTAREKSHIDTDRRIRTTRNDPALCIRNTENRFGRSVQSIARTVARDEAFALQLVDRPCHRLARRADHLREQCVADGEVDPDAVENDVPVLSCQLKQLAPHSLEMTRRREIRNRLVPLTERRRQLLDDSPSGCSKAQQLLGLPKGDRPDPRPAEPEERASSGLGGSKT